VALTHRGRIFTTAAWLDRPDGARSRLARRQHIDNHSERDAGYDIRKNKVTAPAEK
jgi:hypothetical protein